MALDFVKTNVQPGEPVTAQAWNNIVNGLFEVQAILKAAGGEAHVRVTNPGLDLSTVRVTAARTGAPPAEAIRPIAPDIDFIFPRLEAGAYTVSADAPGFTAQTGALNVASDGTVAPDPLELALVPAGSFMPNVLGLKWKDAAPLLNVIHPRVIDAGGKDLPLTGFDAAYNDKPVLMQFPLPGDPAPVTGSFVIVAGIFQQKPLVTTPNLAGLTVAQAQTELAKLGLAMKIVI
jgi:hypothetical protein